MSHVIDTDLPRAGLYASMFMVCADSASRTVFTAKSHVVELFALTGIDVLRSTTRPQDFQPASNGVSGRTVAADSLCGAALVCVGAGAAAVVVTVLTGRLVGCAPLVVALGALDDDVAVFTEDTVAEGGLFPELPPHAARPTTTGAKAAATPRRRTSRARHPGE